jgi:hypothetical protein
MENGTSEEKVQKMLLWMDKIEANLMTKIKKAEDHLEKMRIKLDETKKQDEFSNCLEKIKASENTIEVSQELLISLDQLKTSLMKKSEAP